MSTALATRPPRAVQVRMTGEQAELAAIAIGEITRDARRHYGPARYTSIVDFYVHSAVAVIESLRACRPDDGGGIEITVTLTQADAAAKALAGSNRKSDPAWVKAARLVRKQFTEAYDALLGSSTADGEDDGGH